MYTDRWTFARPKSSRSRNQYTHARKATIISNRDCRPLVFRTTRQIENLKSLFDISRRRPDRTTKTELAHSPNQRFSVEIRA